MNVPYFPVVNTQKRGCGSKEVKAMEDISGTCCRVGARWRFTKIISELEIEEGICKHDPYFYISEKYAANKQESRAFLALVCPFVSPSTYYAYLSRDPNFVVRRFVGYISLLIQTIHQETSQRIGKAVYSLVCTHGTRVSGPSEPISDLATFLRRWLANEFTKTPCE